MFLLPGLRSLPFWTAPHSQQDSSKSNKSSGVKVAFNDPTVSGIVQHLEDNFEPIRQEYLSAVLGIQNYDRPSSVIRTTTDDNDDGRSPFRSPLEPDYDVNRQQGGADGQRLHEGQWDWHSYMQGGVRSADFASHCPVTTRVVDDLGERLFRDNPFAFCFFSTLSGNSRIKPHHGPMNLRLRVHLPLLVPEPSSTSTIQCGLRVGTQRREWVPGKAVVLDDAYEHEVWNDTAEPRVLLLVDVWHPDVSPEERRRITTMFATAQDKGWIGKK